MKDQENKEIEITDEMIDAAIECLSDYDPPYTTMEETAIAIFRAVFPMIQVSDPQEAPSSLCCHQ